MSEQNRTEDEKTKVLPGGPSKEVSTRPMSPSHEPSYESKNTQIRDYCIQRLVDGVSYRALSEELQGQISKTQLHKLFPKEYIDTIRRELQTQQQETSFLQSPQTVVPSAHVVVPLSWLDSYAKTLPKAQKLTIEQMKANILRYNQLLDDQAKQQRRGSSPNPSAYEGRGYDELCHEIAESEKMERLMRLRQGFGRGRSGNDGVESMLKLIKLGVDLVPKGQNVDSIGVYRSGREDQKTDSPGRMGSTNLVDLRLEEMRQSHDLDMQRLSWDQKKYFLKLENDTTKWDKLQETFGPILQTASPEIRDIIRKIGENVGKTLGDLGANPNPNPNAQTEVTSITCPKCASSLNVPIPIGSSKVGVKCPKCMHLFSMGKEDEASSSRPELRPKTRLGYKDS